LRRIQVFPLDQGKHTISLCLSLQDLVMTVRSLSYGAVSIIMNILLRFVTNKLQEKRT